MGNEPTTFCKKCGDAHDVYTIGLCESCEESKINPLEVAKMIDAKSTDILKPMVNEFIADNWPKQFQIILFEAIARKANTYAQRLK